MVNKKPNEYNLKIILTLNGKPATKDEIIEAFNKRDKSGESA